MVGGEEIGENEKVRDGVRRSWDDYLRKGERQVSL